MKSVARFIAGIAASLFSESAKVEGRRRELVFMRERQEFAPFDPKIHKIGDRVIDRQLTFNRLKRTERERDEMEAFVEGEIVGIDMSRGKIVCKWMGPIVYKVNSEGVSEMKPSDVWVLKVNSDEQSALEEELVFNNDPLNSFQLPLIQLPSGEKLASLITIPEVAQDVSKWVAYNTLAPADASILTVAAFGAAAGMIGNSFFEVLKKNSLDKASLLRYMRTGLEGAALFVAYEGCIDFLDHTPNIRKLLGSKLPFIPYV